jgi:hypothetical protein
VGFEIERAETPDTVQYSAVFRLLGDFFNLQGLTETRGSGVQGLGVDLTVIRIGRCGCLFISSFMNYGDGEEDLSEQWSA